MTPTNAGGAARRRHPLAAAAAGTAAILVLAACAWIVLAWPRADFVPSRSPQAWAPSADNVARGAYLARAGGCLACHTARGGAAYAGGRAIDTPFGRLYGPNLTPDPHTGIGAWSADDFWHALHDGVAPGGRLLYPAFPYTHYTRVTRDDADALFAWLRSLAPVRRPNRAHELRFPYDSRLALAGWRLLYFRPGVQAARTDRPAAWNRGAYLVEGLGHCGACHAGRNALGAAGANLWGGPMAGSGWYAPALAGHGATGAAPGAAGELVQLLRSGVSAHGAVSGPMAEVVGDSLQYLSAADLHAMAAYLRTVPAAPAAPMPAPTRAPSDAVSQAGARLYDRHCAACHGGDGRGATDTNGAPAYPPLAGNRTLAAAPPVNAIRAVLHGGFPPATAGNPRPYGMPPFGPVLDDAEVAAVLSYARASWGNAAAPVTAAEVDRQRPVPLD
ncbi:cytochrome c [Massilia forsythiae]|uniref:Cytochrome c n=1 Tax=Massilia forsythiae TaxID=2728020 RepID=A0A7Z2W0T3_9BURK|nr:cytochrome c [Massilia forsythiae]QJE02972.1 cytochrome c [Massilia forsythiae]